MIYFVSFLVALSAVVLLTPLVRTVAVRAGFLDLPNRRKIHRNPTPLLGGLAVLLGFLVAFFLGIRLLDVSFTRPLFGFLIGALWVFLVGLADDKWGVGPLPKLFGQVIGCCFFFFSGNTNGLITSAPLDLVFSFLWVVGMMNALNFLDNMDGIAGGITVLASLGFFVIALAKGATLTALIAAATAGSALAFLLFNFHPASIFLGDAGSLLLGYLLASLGIMSTWHQTSHLFLLVPILILGYPIFDVTFVVFTRISRGSHIYKPGKDHSSHRIRTILANARGTAIAVYAICLVLALAGVFLSLTGERGFYISAFFLAAVASLVSGARLSRVPIQ
ncbi:MAG: undecaprenyl/decaprenyl-phosphate alpha-N-acetylglucosaminyl 1-phosphate transferase [Candidatus Eisenbacteria bacterium]|nr:undecaprenyl/decaprenyl-phosphate alpha-N-acetylglucosaminyl 1-phosphate transferase [Candidatus Eisenbacteria bacterium]